MNDLKTTLTVLLYGESGVGKSWLGDTVPAPRLILDAEGRARYTPSGPKVSWDPRQGPPPAWDGTWNTCVCSVPDFETLLLAYQWLRSGQHQFRSIVIDSLMEAQKRCIDNLAGVNAMQTQDWGELLRRLEGLVRDYRDLTLIPSNPAEVIVYIVGTKDVEGTRRPLLQGQLASTVPYYMDVVGYYFPAPITGPQGETAYQRQLLINAQPGFVAKDGTDRLTATYGAIVPEPNITTFYEILKGTAAPAAAAIGQEVPTA